ncbi:MAG TPA: tetratricopeptide repeat protein [Vicinamibacterales bacterium]|nr:tetratricopeptide repeat protein [Vicinamibacterales bacterium]
MSVMLEFVIAALLMQQPETMSLLEAPLYAPPLPSDVRARLETELASARTVYAKDPANADATLGLARVEMALGHAGDSIELLTRTLEAHPDDVRLSLARGRELIVFRKFDAAERDVRKALETLPEANCSLGLVLYLKGEFTHAREAYTKCADPGVFAYLSDHRAGPSAMPRPAVPADTSTAASDIRLPGSTLPRAQNASAPLVTRYLDASDDIAAGKRDAAADLLKKIVDKYRDNWMEPVYIAAESDYARILKAEGKKPQQKKKRKR